MQFVLNVSDEYYELPDNVQLHTSQDGEVVIEGNYEDIMDFAKIFVQWAAADCEDGRHLHLDDANCFSTPQQELVVQKLEKFEKIRRYAVSR